MKNLLTLIISLFGATAYAQFPVTQTLGSPTTIIKSKGAFKADSLFVNAVYPDTIKANTNPSLKAYPGGQIFTTSDNSVWYRNATATGWIKYSSGAGSAGWGLTGNAGTNPATNFLGTTDNNSLRIRTNNIPVAIFDSVGKVGFGTASPVSNFEVTQGTTGLGTVSNLAGDSTITGIGTDFTNLLKADKLLPFVATELGDSITIGGVSRRVISIASNTSLVLNAAIPGANSNVPFTLIRAGNRFSVRGNGNVSIGGISNPTERLDVRGNIKLNGSYLYVKDTALRIASTGAYDKIVETRDYNTVYSGFGRAGRFSSSYGTFFGVNASGRPNVVYNMLSYNALLGGGREISTEAAFRYGLESSYEIGGVPHFEFHLPEVTNQSGVSHRPLTMYVNKVSGYTTTQMDIDQLQIINRPNLLPLLTSSIQGLVATAQTEANTFAQRRINASNVVQEQVSTNMQGGYIYNTITGSHINNYSTGQQNTFTDQIPGTNYNLIFTKAADLKTQFKSGNNTARIMLHNSNSGDGMTNGTILRMLDEDTYLTNGQTTGKMYLQSNNGIGMGAGAVVAASAALDITSTAKGLLIPRMTTTQRDAIVSPASSLMIFNTTANKYEYYDATAVAWASIGGGGGATPLLFGGTAAGSNIIYKSTTGAGTAAGIAHQFTGGTDGATVIQTMLNNGNVGIGTAAPDSKLRVVGGNCELRIDFGNGGTQNYIDAGAGSTGFTYMRSNVSVFNKLSVGFFSGATPAATVDVKGAGATSATYGLQVNNSTGTNNALIVRDDGNVGMGTASPAASALLDITSTTKGFLPPRMTAAQMVAISSPATGLEIYNTTTNTKNIFNGTNWTGGLTASSAATLTIIHGQDYVFTGTTSTWTLPAVSATLLGRGNSITIKNRGTGAITLNSNAGSTIYSSIAVGTFTISPGEAIMLMPDGTFFNVE